MGIMTDEFDEQLLLSQVSKKDLIRHIKYEQECLWDDLVKDLHFRAQNGYWSIGVERTVWRIYHHAKLVGPTRDSRVDMNIVASGIYGAIMKRLDVNWVIPHYAVEYLPRSSYTSRILWPHAVPHILAMDMEEVFESE